MCALEQVCPMLFLCIGLWLVGTWVTSQKERAQMCYNALPTSTDLTKQTPSALNNQCIARATRSRSEALQAAACSSLFQATRVPAELHVSVALLRVEGGNLWEIPGSAAFVCREP